MLIFIDESGDCGMELDRGASDRFTLSAVFFEIPGVAEACDQAIRELRRKKGWSDAFEFHFHAASDARRAAFLETVAAHEFLYVVSTLETGRLTGHHWGDKAFSYQEAARRLVDPLEDLMRIAHACTGARGKVLIDDNQDPVYLHVMQEQLKRPKTDDGKPLVKKVQAARSRTENLLQLADMVCGGIGHLENTGSDEYLRPIRARQAEFRTWP
jgi:hypothetical protein